MAGLTADHPSFIHLVNLHKKCIIKNKYSIFGRCMRLGWGLLLLVDPLAQWVRENLQGLFSHFAISVVYPIALRLRDAWNGLIIVAQTGGFFQSMKLPHTTSRILKSRILAPVIKDHDHDHEEEEEDLLPLLPLLDHDQRAREKRKKTAIKWPFFRTKSRKFWPMDEEFLSRMIKPGYLTG